MITLLDSSRAIASGRNGSPLILDLVLPDLLTLLRLAVLRFAVCC
jgi:hypothetical protein